jgi:hypothetical protein
MFDSDKIGIFLRTPKKSFYYKTNFDNSSPENRPIPWRERRTEG